MARVNNLSNFLTDVASAIKTKKGSETAIPAASFDTEILALPSQGVYQTKVVTVTQNGQTVITPDTGYDAMDGVQVTTNVPEKQLQTKSYDFTTNQTIELLPDTGYDGFDTVTLSINVPSSGRQSIKLFSTVEAMNADPDIQFGDKAIVYGQSSIDIQEGRPIHNLYLTPRLEVESYSGGTNSLNVGYGTYYLEIIISKTKVTLRVPYWYTPTSARQNSYTWTYDSDEGAYVLDDGMPETITFDVATFTVYRGDIASFSPFVKTKIGALYGVYDTKANIDNTTYGLLNIDNIQYSDGTYIINNDYSFPVSISQLQTLVNKIKTDFSMTTVTVAGITVFATQNDLYATFLKNPSSGLGLWLAPELDNSTLELLSPIVLCPNRAIASYSTYDIKVYKLNVELQTYTEVDVSDYVTNGTYGTTTYKRLTFPGLKYWPLTFTYNSTNKDYSTVNVASSLYYGTSSTATAKSITYDTINYATPYYGFIETQFDSDNRDIRLGATYLGSEGVIEGVLDLNGAVIFPDEATMQADTSTSDGTYGLVFNTSTNEFGGLYIRDTRDIDTITMLKGIVKTGTGYNTGLTYTDTLVLDEGIYTKLQNIIKQVQTDRGISYYTNAICIQETATTYTIVAMVQNGTRLRTGILADGTNYCITNNYTSNISTEYLVVNVDLEDIENYIVNTYTDFSTVSGQQTCYNLDSDKYVFSIGTGSVSIFGTNSGTSASNTNRCEYTFEFGEDSRFWIVPATNLSLQKTNQLLPNVVGYGRNGLITGDGSIYDNLDDTVLFNLMYGEENLIKITNYDIHKNADIHQVVTSHIGNHGLTEFVKTYDTLIDGCHTGFKLPDNIELTNFNVVSSNYAYKYDKDSNLVQVKDVQTGIVTDYTIQLADYYSVRTNYYNDTLTFVCQHANMSSQTTFIVLDFTTGSIRNTSVNYDTSYVSSYSKPVCITGRYNDKLYFHNLVCTSDNTFKVTFGYINTSTMTITVLFTSNETSWDVYVYLAFVGSGITTNKQFVIQYYKFGDGSNYDHYKYYRIYDITTDALITNKLFQTSNYVNGSINPYGISNQLYFRLLVDDGTYIYGTDNYAIEKSTGEIYNLSILTQPYGLPDLTYSYEVQSVTDPEDTHFTETSLVYTNLTTGVSHNYYVPHYIGYFITTESIDEDTGDIISTKTPVINNTTPYPQIINNELYINEDLRFITKLHRVELADPTDYDWLLTCSMCYKNYFLPQFFYTHNPEINNSEEVTNGENE